MAKVIRHTLFLF